MVRADRKHALKICSLWSVRAEKTLQKCFRNDPSEIVSSFDRGWGPPFRPKPGPSLDQMLRFLVFGGCFLFTFTQDPYLNPHPHMATVFDARAWEPHSLFWIFDVKTGALTRGGGSSIQPLKRTASRKESHKKYYIQLHGPIRGPRLLLATGPQKI